MRDGQRDSGANFLQPDRAEADALHEGAVDQFRFRGDRELEVGDWRSRGETVLGAALEARYSR
jgi:hypothetical protein